MRGGIGVCTEYIQNPEEACVPESRNISFYIDLMENSGRLLIEVGKELG